MSKNVLSIEIVTNACLLGPVIVHSFKRQKQYVTVICCYICVPEKKGRRPCGPKWKACG